MIQYIIAGFGFMVGIALFFFTFSLAKQLIPVVLSGIGTAVLWTLSKTYCRLFKHRFPPRDKSPWRYYHVSCQTCQFTRVQLGLAVEGEDYDGTVRR
jgi:hypothetical protein